MIGWDPFDSEECAELGTFHLGGDMGTFLTR